MTYILIEHEGKELTAYEGINYTRLTMHYAGSVKPMLDVPTAMLDELAAAWCASRGIEPLPQPITRGEKLASLIHDACLAQEMFETDELEAHALDITEAHD